MARNKTRLSRDSITTILGALGAISSSIGIAAAASGQPQIAIIAGIIAAGSQSGQAYFTQTKPKRGGLR